ncbi:hypothetical protein BOTBODRAFT_144680 [Botryobasidium botryosum FD-172 SS1]|uniref:Uncharacterized protein n=1 Tax=Botryobasidium botryosum (strain FD-172 SS1) TaxID=930990 RepID=A0A067ML57_BOTB1|nr:hypothetical protein BOTBODRAFT_144680 [Botryobasidium botryosum FD-172 SS1]
MTEQSTTLRLSQKPLQLSDQFITSTHDDQNAEAYLRDPATIHSLEHEAEHLDMITTYFASEAAQVRKRRNELVPINSTLPNEILSYIFQTGACEDFGDKDPFPFFAVTVSHVCHLWRSVALAIPALWPLFSHKTPIEFTMRAQSTPLDLVIHPHKFSLAGLSNMAATIFPCAGSIRIMVLPHQERFIMSWLGDAPAPRLSRLSIGSLPRQENYPGEEVERIWYMLSPHPFTGQHPSLREISIRDGAIPWDTPLLSGLQVLRLESINVDLHINMATFISVLQSCPKVEVLSLDNAGPMSDSPDLMMDTISLPALRSFSWKNGTRESPLQLLNHIAVPRTATIDIFTRFPSQWMRGRNDSESFPGDFGTVLEVALSQCQTLELNHSVNHSPYARGFDYILYEPETKAIKFSLTHVSSGSQKIQNVLNVVQLHLPIRTEHVILNGMRKSELESLVRLLRALPNTATISFTDCECDADVISALSEEGWWHSVRDVSFTRSRIPAEIIISFAQSRPLDTLFRLSFHECDLITPATVEILRPYALAVIRTEPQEGSPESNSEDAFEVISSRWSGW